MASAICTPTFSSPSSFTTKSALYTISSSIISYPKTPKFHLSTWGSQLGLCPFSPWSGLKHLGISITPKSIKSGRKGKCKGKVVYASLFGVGAPEALVIGVVALLVFGPKGLAEVARNLGKTLRTFQPTIKELQEVSREFKSTLEREIGLDDISTPNTYSSSRPDATSTPSSTTSTEDSQTVVDPNGTSSPKQAYTTEEYLKITEEQIKASTAQQQGQTPSAEGKLETQTQPQATIQEAATTTPPPQKPGSES
ncbi:sec-independent protein translocase protein TATB, chloroplastic [Fagus crenata]